MPDLNDPIDERFPVKRDVAAPRELGPSVPVCSFCWNPVPAQDAITWHDKHFHAICARDLLILAVGK